MFELVPFESIKDLLDLEKESAKDYPALQIIKMSVDAAIENELGRELEQKARTETTSVTACGTSHIYLNAVPVVSVASVTVDGTALDSDDYTIMAGGLRLATEISGVDVVVVYTGGYAQDEIPASLERAALIQTAYEYQTKEHVGATSVTTDGGTVSTPALQILPVVKNLLSKNKHPWLGTYGI